MKGKEVPDDYFIWGIDDSPYGPVALSVLIDCISDERVLADTWVFARHDGNWRRAAEIPELQAYFSQAITPDSATASGVGIAPGSLRRIKFLAQLNDAQLDHLSRFMEQQPVPRLSAVVKQGDPGDGMYLILQGELRARVMTGGQETILSTFGPGDFFGDMSLFDRGPRSADVVANHDSLVVKISAAAFDKLAKEAPEIATPFLRAVGRTLSARIRTDNKRYGDSVKFSRAA